MQQSQNIQILYQQLKTLDCNNQTGISRLKNVVEQLLAQNRDNTELLILQMQLEIMSSQEQRARMIAHRIWEVGGNISPLFEKMYLDTLMNLGLLEMAMLLIKPRFEKVADSAMLFPLEMLKFALMTGSVSLMRRVVKSAPSNAVFSAIEQFCAVYEKNRYEDYFKNIQKIVLESFGQQICAYDYNIFTDRGFTDIEIVLYFNNEEVQLSKYKMLLESKVNGYCLTVGIKRINNLSFVFKNIKDHPKF